MRCRAIAMLLLLCAAAGADVFTASADRAQGRELEDGEVVVDLEGNVRVTDGEVVVTSLTGRVWQTAGRALFEGDVVVVSDTVTATSDRLDYRSEAGIIRLTGDVELTDGDNVINAREVVYFRDQGKATARDSVVMTGPWLGRVTGEYALYDRNRGSLFVTVDPVLRRAGDGDSMTVTADRLEFFPDSNRAEAQGSAHVDVPAREITADAEYLRYYGDRDRFELIGSPVVVSPDGTLAGDWMSILMHEGSLSEVQVEGAAEGDFTDSGVDPPATGHFTSEGAKFMFDAAGDLDSIFVRGSVHLEVRSGGEAAERAETNTVTGDRLYISYSDGSPQTIRVAGSVSGTYSYRGEAPARRDL
ncbi:MAG: LptA/OstA family protein [Candidatus Fermentibacteraceae bacterium]